MKFKQNIAALGLLLLLNACSVTQKMGANKVPYIKAPDKKAITTALMKANETGLKFKPDKSGNLRSQTIELEKDYAVQIIKNSEGEMFLTAFNPKALKEGVAQMQATIPLNAQSVKPTDLKLIIAAAMTPPNYKPDNGANIVTTPKSPGH